MAKSAHAYVRGSSDKFYEWLASVKPSSLPEGPPIWICGDCHLGNLGPVGDASGQVAIQIRDMDQTVIGNPAHDLIRLGVSLATAARGSDLPGVVTAQMTAALISGYLDALARDTSSELPSKPVAVRTAMKTATRRTWKQLARDRIKNPKPNILLGKRFWPLRREESKAIERICENEALLDLVTCLYSGRTPESVKLLDAAFWVKGCSSMGRLRYAVLLGIDARDGSKYRLFDFKEAVAPAAPLKAKCSMPLDNGERVVEGARHLAPFLGMRMASARILDKSVFVRELLPQDLKLEIDTLSQADATRVARYLGMVVGLSHAGQLSRSEAAAWRRELMRHGKSLAAPFWLWTSIVDLVGVHERQYLEHCRRWALGRARTT
ncbi:hypothetical protein RM96_19820 [Cupriavidus sp. IDO]|nr:hypothetical protein RM96_19820 [Cupriavidus sp. IDO]